MKNYTASYCNSKFAFDGFLLSSLYMVLKCQLLSLMYLPSYGACFCCFFAKLLLANKFSERNGVSYPVLPFSGGERPQMALITGYEFSWCLYVSFL